MDKRPYRSPLRQEQAEATRERIIEAGLDLFAEHGYPGTTVAEIARAAGVSPETIYASVGSKRGIVDAHIARIDTQAIGVGARREAAARGGDPRSSLAVIAEISADFWGTQGRLVRMLRSGVGDAEIGHAWLERQIARRQLIRDEIASWPADALRAGASVDRATDIAWTLTSHDVYSLLVDVRGWTRQELVDWSREAMIRELLADG